MRRYGVNTCEAYHFSHKAKEHSTAQKRHESVHNMNKFLYMRPRFFASFFIISGVMMLLSVVAKVICAAAWDT